MPCGHRDARRNGHRCGHCKKHHVKCDGKRPCRFCSLRGLDCEESEPTTKGFTMVQYRPRKARESINQVLGDDAWNYICTFFETVKVSDPPLLSAFHFSNIGQLVLEQGPVFDAVVAAGVTYSNKKSAQTSAKVEAFRKQICQEFGRTSALTDPTFLLRVHLLGLIELMTDETGGRWSMLIQQLQYHYLPLSEYLSPSLWKTQDSRIMRLTKLTIVIRELMFTETEAKEEEKAKAKSARIRIPGLLRLPGPQAVSLDSLADKAEYVVRMLERWAIMRNRCLTWANHSRDSAQRKVEGLEIIDMACAIQQDIVTTMLQPAIDVDFMKPICHWIIAGICRVFSSPEWQDQDWDLPVMQGNLLHDQALEALEGAERMVKKAPFESVFYGTISPVIALQMYSAEDRERVITLLRDIGKTGYKVALAFEADVRESWTGIAQEITC